MSHPSCPPEARMLQSGFPAVENTEYWLCCVFSAAIRAPETGKFPLQRAHPNQLVVYSCGFFGIQGNCWKYKHSLAFDLFPVFQVCTSFCTQSQALALGHTKSPWFYWDSRNPQTATAGTCRSFMTENPSFKRFKAGKGLQFCLCLGILKESREERYWTQFQRLDSAVLGT